MGFTEFYRILPIAIRFSQVPLGIIGFCWVLPSFTGFYRVLLGFTEFRRISPHVIRFSQVPLGILGFCWVVLGFLMAA